MCRPLMRVDSYHRNRGCSIQYLFNESYSTVCAHIGGLTGITRSSSIRCLLHL